MIALARQEKPDTSPFNDPEIVYRLDKKQHVGFVVASESSERVDALLSRYIERVAKDYLMVLPASDRPVN